ncbi:MAG TPA: phosphodiester glycosidase family protein, partial [Verrucomicrobiae bacterium]|nr:phosphodiester glycosidase family protein [Verrucomicrobiae bacterium]
RSRTNLDFATTLAPGGRIGLSVLTTQIRALPKGAGRPLAAINGDFHRIRDDDFGGDPRGLQIRFGELVSAPVEKTCFWITPAGVPRIDDVEPDFYVLWPGGEKTRFELNEERSGNEVVLYTTAMGDTTGTRGGTDVILESPDAGQPLILRAGEGIPAKVREVRRGGNSPIQDGTLVLSMGGYSQSRSPVKPAVGDRVTISTMAQPDLKGVRTAIGGGPVIVRDSKVVPTHVFKGNERHPRSAVGWNKTDVLFIVVDGRQRDSVGMTLRELAEVLVRLKCEEAMNLDGGGSTEIWMGGRILNSPCYGRERPTANGLVVVEKAKDEKQ